MAEARAGTTRIFENEQIKVWEFTLGGGTRAARNIRGRGYHDMVELKARR